MREDARYAAPAQPIPYSQLDAYMNATPRQRVSLLTNTASAPTATTGMPADTSAAAAPPADASTAAPATPPAPPAASDTGTMAAPPAPSPEATPPVAPTTPPPQ